MTAKQAQQLMKKAQRQPKVVAPPAEQKTPLEEKIDSWDWNIEHDAQKGEKYTELSHPGDELFPQLKAHFEKKGFRVSEYSTDEGYCIGDVWHVQIDWA
jgi:hypothetical protein